MSKYEFILFDLDGTLTDPKVGITKSVQYALAKYDIKVDKLEDLEVFIGPPLEESFKEYYSFSNERAKEAVQYYREYFSERGIFENEVYPDIPKLLDELKKKGKVLIVATSKPTVFASRILEHFKLINYFDFVAGSNLDGTRTAKVEVIKHAFSEIGVTDLDKAVMIGDRKHDVIGGSKNCIDTIGVTYGYGTYEELKEVNPTYIAKSINDLLDIML